MCTPGSTVVGVGDWLEGDPHPMAVCTDSVSVGKVGKVENESEEMAEKVGKEMKGQFRKYRENEWKWVSLYILVFLLYIQYVCSARGKFNKNRMFTVCEVIV